MTLKGILFDNDGTLVDTYELILNSCRYATRTVLGHELPADVLMKKVGQPLVTQLADFTPDPEKRKQLWDAYQDYNLSHHDETVSLFPGVEDALRALKEQGYVLGVVTSKRHAVCQHGLELTGIAHFFDCLIGTEDCDTHKPEPGPVLAGCAALGFAPEECVYVGDSPYDLESGNRAGALTVAAQWGMFPASVLAAESPTAECAAPANLPAAINALTQCAR